MNRILNFIKSVFLPYKSVSFIMADFEQLRNKYVKTFEEFIQQNENPWKTPEELAKITGTTIEEVTKVMNFDDFVENSKGQFNTKENYLKHENFFKRYIDLLDGEIL